MNKANLTLSSIFFSITLIPFLASPTSALTISSPEPKIYVQGVATFNISSPYAIKISEVYFEELYNNNVTHYGATNETVENQSLSFKVTYQLIDKDTDMLKVTVFYYVGVDLFQESQYFYVFVPPPSNNLLIALGFVIVCAIIGTYFTYRWVKNRTW